MASTNRQFDDERIIKQLGTKHGFSIGDASRVEVNVIYDPPTENSIPMASITVMTRFDVSKAEADEILDFAK